MSYGGPQGGAEYGVPDMVKQFVVYFYRHIRERNIREIQSMYDVSFVKLSERFFKGQPWPPVDAISELVDHDHVFCMLYKEMYFRHLYAITQPSLEARAESWANYTALFGVILHGNVNMQLPNGWLWDMIDEFVYQFQSFAQYRGKLSMKSADEVNQLRAAEEVWNVLGVLNYLQALVGKSAIVEELAAPGGAARLKASDGFVQGQSNVLRMLGYFSLVGLQRVHALTGDYHGALKAMAPLNLFEARDLLTPAIVGCNISVYYYGGFCYMMQRRYLDAARAFNTILAFIHRVKGFHQRSAQYEQILKKNEQMFALLAITSALCPPALADLNETVLNLLQEKYGEKRQRMVLGDQGVFDELFSYACPKFITASPPDYDAPSANTNQEAYRLQLKMFLALLHQQRSLPGLKQLLKLYTSISLPKLAGLMEMDGATLRSQLMLLKSTAFVKTWNGSGDATEGVFLPAADVDFHIDVDPTSGEEMVTVEEAKPIRRQDDFLAEHIVKFNTIVRDLQAITPVAAAPVAPAPRALPAY
jgi:translation initiation factor 3 subunit L